MNVGELIKTKRQALGITQKQIAEYVGVSEGTVSRWESGNIGNMRRDRIAKLAEILHVSPTAIMGVDEDSESAPDTEERPAYIKRIPILGHVVAGEPVEAIENIEGWEEIDTRDPLFRDGKFYALKVKGDSMLPTMRDGDTIIVKMQNYIEDKEIGVIMVNGDEATVKQVNEGPNGITLIGHNLAVYEPHSYTREQIENLPVRVIAKVVEMRRRF